MNIYELEKQTTPGPLAAKGGCVGCRGLGGERTVAVTARSRATEVEDANERLIVHCRNNFMRALQLLHEALPYVQFYDDHDHPYAVEAAKIACEKLQNGIAELEEVIA